MKKGREKDRPKMRPFVALPWELLNSQAYKRLPPSASKALPYFLGKVKLSPNASNRFEQEFEFPYREGKKMGFAFATFSKIIQDLMKYGFIDPVDRGGLRGDGKSSNKFTLSKRWEDFGSEKFERVDWKRFHPQL